MFKEWTSRRPWKERKKANKSGPPQLVSRSQPPELIYYGRHSGVVGLTKEELYKNVSDNVIANCGYDKVNSTLIAYCSVICFLLLCEGDYLLGFYAGPRGCRMYT